MPLPRPSDTPHACISLGPAQPREVRARLGAGRGAGRGRGRGKGAAVRLLSGGRHRSASLLSAGPPPALSLRGAWPPSPPRHGPGRVLETPASSTGEAPAGAPASCARSLATPRRRPGGGALDSAPTSPSPQSSSQTHPRVPPARVRLHDRLLLGLRSFILLFFLGFSRGGRPGIVRVGVVREGRLLWRRRRRRGGGGDVHCSGVERGAARSPDTHKKTRARVSMLPRYGTRVLSQEEGAGGAYVKKLALRSSGRRRCCTHSLSRARRGARGGRGATDAACGASTRTYTHGEAEVVGPGSTGAKRRARLGGAERNASVCMARKCFCSKASLLRPVFPPRARAAVRPPLSAHKTRPASV